MQPLRERTRVERQATRARKCRSFPALDSRLLTLDILDISQPWTNVRTTGIVTQYGGFVAFLPGLPCPQLSSI